MKPQFFLLLLSYSMLLFSQNDRVVSLDTTLYTDYAVRSLGDGLMYTKYDNTLIVIDCNQKLHDEFLTFEKINLSSLKSSSGKLYFTKKHERFTNLKFYGLNYMWCDNSKLYVGVFDRLYVFSKVEDNYYLSDSTDVKFDNVWPINDTALVFSYKDNVGLYNLNSHSYVFQKHLIFPISSLKLFVPRDIVCYYNGRILYTTANEYKIYVCDTLLNIRDSITRNKIDWKLLTKDEEDSILKGETEPADIIYLYADTIRSFSSICRLLPLGDYLVVMFNRKKENRLEFLYDLWKMDLKTNQWSLIAENVNDYMSGDRSKDRLFPFQKFVFYDGYVYSISAEVPIKRENYECDNDFKKAYDKYEIKNDRVLTVRKLMFVR